LNNENPQSTDLICLSQLVQGGVGGGAFQMAFERLWQPLDQASIKYIKYVAAKCNQASQIERL